METEVMPRVKRRSRYAESWVFFEGEIVLYEDAYLPPMTHALHYGTGCFEGIRAYWNSSHKQLYLLQAEAHFARLRRSAAILRLDLPYSNEELVRSTELELAAKTARKVLRLQTFRAVRRYLTRVTRRICPNVAFLDTRK